MSRKIDACFFCTTPYQVIASIFLVKQLNITADLYVVNQFSYAEQLGEYVQKENLFNEVHVVDQQLYTYKGDEKKARWLIWMKCAWAYVRINKISSKILFKDTTYNKMFASGRNFIFELIDQYFQKNKIQTKQFMFDDGVGSYIPRSEVLTTTHRLQITQRILLGKTDTRQAEPDFLYSPELYYKINGNTGKEIQKINNGFHDKDLLASLNRIFQVQESDIINEKAILIDLLKGRDFDSREREKIDEVYQKIFAAFGEENIMVKRHPRDVEPERAGVKYYQNYQIPFECICMNMDCNHKVLLSAASTAVITPKLLMDQEPYVILLYKLIWPNSWGKQKFDQTDGFFKTFKSMYEQSERFMIPEDMEELESCFVMVKNKRYE